MKILLRNVTLSYWSYWDFCFFGLSFDVISTSYCSCDIKYLLDVAMIVGTCHNFQSNVLENLEVGYGHVMMFPPER